MKVVRLVMKIVALVMVVAAAVCAIVAFWDKIVDLFYTIADKLEEKKADRSFLSEYDDYADCEL
jgi:protein-S-isoprenylcysteine O-methyltransferase Ste14